MTLAQLVKLGKSAVGIPDRSAYGDPSKLPVGEPLPFVVQMHRALKAGPHRDIRIGKDRMLSWASRHGMAEPGKRRMLIPQPLHEESYRTFQGTIPEGYGAGEVSTEDIGEVVVTKATPKHIRFVTASSGEPRSYGMVKTVKDGRTYWLMSDDTETRPVKDVKPHYIKIPAEDIDRLMDPDMVMSKKIDGARNILRIMRDGAKVLSYRTSVSGAPIEHTARIMPELAGMKFPKRLHGGEYVGEVYGERGGRAIPPQELGGLLNSSVAKALRNREARKIKLKMALFGVAGRPEMPVGESRAEVQKVLKHLPGEVFTEPEYAYTAAAKRRMWGRIKSGRDPVTREGVVGLPVSGGVPLKVKLRPEYDVVIKDILPGEGKYKGVGAGSFTYSEKPGGPEIGRVGTGLTDETRRDMLEHPEKYIGRTARVSAQERYPGGALRAPGLVAVHEDVPQVKNAQMRMVAPALGVYYRGAAMQNAPHLFSGGWASAPENIYNATEMGYAANAAQSMYRGAAPVIQSQGWRGVPAAARAAGAHIPGITGASSGGSKLLGRIAAPAWAASMGVDAAQMGFRNPATGEYNLNVGQNMAANQQDILNRSRTVAGGALTGAVNPMRTIATAGMTAGNIGQSAVNAWRNMWSAGRTSAAVTPEQVRAANAARTARRGV